VDTSVVELSLYRAVAMYCAVAPRSIVLSIVDVSTATNCFAGGVVVVVVVGGVVVVVGGFGGFGRVGSVGMAVGTGRPTAGRACSAALLVWWVTAGPGAEVPVGAGGAVAASADVVNPVTRTAASRTDVARLCTDFVELT
jgi:hypothetical protein